MTQAILQLLNAECYYSDGTCALKGLSVSFPKAKRIVVLGANGAGKSSLFLALNGILPLKKGKLIYDNKEIAKKDLKDLRTKVGIVFQDPDSQIISADVKQEISFGPFNLGLPKDEVIKRVKEAMAATEIEHLSEKATHNLSYGQKKRVAIADILAMYPEVLILDEPLAWLDPKHASDIIELFGRLTEAGKTVVVSTHDVNMAYTFAEYCVVVKEGRVIAEGLPENIFTDDKLLTDAELEIPDIIKIYRECGLMSDKLPKTVDELIFLLRKVIKNG